jgi:hypothetical protein
MNVHPAKLHTAVAIADLITARESPILVGRYIEDAKGNSLALEFLTKDGLFGRITVPREGGSRIMKGAVGALVSGGPLLAFMAKHPAVSPIVLIGVKLIDLDLQLDADGDVMWFTGLSKKRLPKEPTLPETPVADYEGSPSELVSDGLPVELRPAWGDRLPVSIFVVQQAIGLLQPMAVLTKVFDRGQGKATVVYGGQRDGLTLHLVAPLRDEEPAQP